MKIKSAFFVSVNHDHQYNVKDTMKMITAIHTDGIFQDVRINDDYSINDCFRVKTYSGMYVKVGPGKCYFNNVWLLNDAPFIIKIPDSNMILNRWDVVFIEINKNINDISCKFNIISGEPGDIPEKPILTNEDNIYKYPLAYVYVNANTSEILQEDITDMVGTNETPYVKYIGKGINIDLVNNLNETNPGKVLDATQGNALSIKYPFGFGKDSNDNYGYYKNGVFVPFINTNHLIKLGTVTEDTTIDCKQYSGYEQFTNDNFFIKSMKSYDFDYGPSNEFNMSAFDQSMRSQTWTGSVVVEAASAMPKLSYNPSTGILTISDFVGSGNLTAKIRDSSGEQYKQNTFNYGLRFISFDVYLII